MDGLAPQDDMDLVEQTDESGAHVSPGLPEGVKNYLIDIDGQWVRISRMRRHTGWLQPRLTLMQ